MADRRVVESPTADATAVEFLLRFTRVAHRAGYPTADLEERILALASSLGLGEAQVSATPTIVEVSLGKLPHQRSYTLRVQPTTVELNAISRLDDLIQDVLDDRLDPAQALAALDAHPGHAARTEVADHARRLRTRGSGADAGARRWLV